MIDMIYAALPMCAQTEKTIFSCKDDYAKLNIYMGVGARDLYIDEAHTALDIFRFAVFFIIKCSSIIINPLSPGILDPGNNPGGGLEDPQLENGVRVA